MVERQKKIHDVKPRENLDRAAFLLAFVVGAFGGIFLKILGAHPFAAAGFSATVLFGYALSAWIGGRLNLEPEAIGDNCYYLGFLFTLASLSFTLYQVADPALAGGQPVNIPDVISGFGVALSSTIVGVFLRVFMMQMRPDFVAKDRAVRADLNQSYGEFRRNLSEILSQMKAFSTESIQYAAERDGRLREATEKYVIDHQDALIQAADNVSKSMMKSFADASQEAVEDISASVRQANKASQDGLLALMSEIQALKERLKEQEVEAFEENKNRRQRLKSELEAAEKQTKAHEAALRDYIDVTVQTADAMKTQFLPVLIMLKKQVDNISTDAEFRPSVQNVPLSPEEMEKLLQESSKLSATPLKAPPSRKRGPDS